MWGCTWIGSSNSLVPIHRPITPLASRQDESAWSE
jgi:hypothetical protein